MHMYIPIHRENPNTRTPEELAAGDTERTNAAYLRYVSIRAQDRRTRNLSAFWYMLFISMGTCLAVSSESAHLKQAQTSQNVNALIKEVNDSYCKLTKEEIEKVTLIGYMLGSLINANAQQVEMILKNFLQDSAAQKLPQLYISSLKFVSEHISSQNEAVRDNAKKVFTTVLSVCRDFHIKTYTAQILNQASTLLFGLNKISQVSSEQAVWLAFVVSVLRAHHDGSQNISNENCMSISTSITNKLIAMPNQSSIQQEIFCSLFFVANMITTREPVIKAAAINVLNTIFDTISSVTKNKSGK